MAEADRRIAASARGQQASFSRRQAHAAGLTNAMLRSRVLSGTLVRTGTHAFSSALAPRTALAELWSVVLDLGLPAWVCGETAAALHGFDGAPLRRPFHIAVPRGRYLTRPGLELHTVARLDPIDRTTIDGLPVVSPSRCIIELAARASADELAVAIDGALRDRLTSEDFLRRRAVALRGRGRPGIGLLLDVLDARDVSRGGDSYLERAFLRLLTRAGLPAPQCQVELDRDGRRIGRVDCVFPPGIVVVELLGYRWHRTAAQLRRDVERINQLQLSGRIGLQFTYRQVIDDEDRVAADVGDALERARSRQHP
jgi:hypothetical protein